jgi:GNAT superfamily N-acetyltransferase
MEVRYARPEELNVIAKIIRDQIYPEISLEEMEEWIKGIGWPSNPYVQWFVLEKEGEIIGAMRWEVYDRYGEKLVLMSSWIAVREGYQKQGYGRYLWQKSKEIVDDYWKSRGCKVKLIFTETEEENLRACAFYRRALGNNLIEVRMQNTWHLENNIVWFFKEI